jgi:arginyl-tRNA synthetase
VRWFLIARKPDSQLVFDIDLARSQSLDNPVYYVQLSHARICSLFRKAAERGLSFDATAGLDQPLDIEDSIVRNILIDLSRWPEIVETAGKELEPHQIATFLVELAQSFQSFFNEYHFVVDDADTRNGRLAIAHAVRQVLANGLDLLGVSAPEEMFFADTDGAEAA